MNIIEIKFFINFNFDWLIRVLRRIGNITSVTNFKFRIVITGIFSRIFFINNKGNEEFCNQNKFRTVSYFTLQLLFLASLTFYAPPNSATYTYPDFAIAIGQFFAVLPLLPVLFFMIWEICHSEGTFIQVNNI